MARTAGVKRKNDKKSFFHKKRSRVDDPKSIGRSKIEDFYGGTCEQHTAMTGVGVVSRDSVSSFKKIYIAIGGDLSEEP